LAKPAKVRPDAVLANGQERIYPDGYYCIRTYLGDKPQYTNVGTDPAEALQKQQREEKLLTARDSAQVAGIEIVEPASERHCVNTALISFTRNHLSHIGAATRWTVTALSLEILSQAVPQNFPEQIEAVDVLRYCAGVEKQGLSPVLVRIGSARFCTFLRFCKVKVAEVIPCEMRKKLGRFPKNEPTAYAQKELDKLLSVCDDYYRLLFTFLTNTGFRMQETMHLTWADVSFVDFSCLSQAQAGSV